MHDYWVAVYANEQTVYQLSGNMTRPNPSSNHFMKPPPSSQHNMQGNVNAPPLRCPLCAGELMRIPRRPIDRFTSLFGTRHRFRCERFTCQWEGNLRPDDAAQADGANSEH